MFQKASVNRYQILHTYLIKNILLLTLYISSNLFHFARNNSSALKQAEFRGCVIQIYEERQELLHFECNILHL